MRTKDELFMLGEVSTLLQYLFMSEKHTITFNNGLTDLQIRMDENFNIWCRNLQFSDIPESNLHSIGRYNGSLSLYRKCLYIRREDSLFYKYGEDNTGDVQRLKQFMRRCCREISLWKKVF